ncbi:MAG: hypothetical protein LBG48_03640 [Rickettsiales bacterium]|nr:hypothetical protein [Rickettsiales bacterium]
MKIVKFLFILILLGLSFVFGMKYGEIKSKKDTAFIGENTENIGGRKGVVGSDIPEDIESINIEIKEEAVFDEVLIEEIIPSEDNENQDGQQTVTEDFNADNFEVGAASDILEQTEGNAQQPSETPQTTDVQQPVEAVTTATEPQTDVQTLPATL